MDDTPPAFTGRILAMKNAHDPSLSVADTVSYGTAVAGYIVASGVCDELGGDVSGIAPAARLVIQSLIDGDGNWSPVKLRGIFERPYRDQNVRIVNNSFGPAHGFQPAYGDTEEPNTIDHLVCEYPDLLFVNATGNTGSDDETPRVAALGSAKNAITVGASRSRRRQDQKGTPNPQGLCHSKTDIAPFSSAGPTRERFTSPHLMALARRSESLALAPLQITNPLGYMSGTSFACPMISGCCAVVREMILACSTEYPAASLIKAIMINAANGPGTVAGEGEGLPGPRWGWGLANLDAVLRRTGLDHGYHRGLSQGEQVLIHLPVVAETMLKTTLVWSDPPGDHLVNDLRLDVFANGDQDRRELLATDQRQENVRQLCVNLSPLPSQARWPLCVTGVNYGFVPGYTPERNQPFALVYSLDPVSHPIT